ncbi:MAG: 50S ribosomal protein L2 [Thermocladium sp.]
MGKRILVQRRGRGGSQFINPKWRRDAPLRYVRYEESQLRETIKGIVKELMHISGVFPPAAHIVLQDGREMYLPAVEGLYVGKIIEFGTGARVETGNIMPIQSIPEGTMISNIEKRPGDGGKYARSNGSYAVVLVHKGNFTSIQLPSGIIVDVDSRSRATIGIVAGGGRTEKPMVKAGVKYHLAKSKSWKYPLVRGKAMSAYAHPHGGGSHQHGGTPVPRNAPPGQKVGFIAPMCTGRGCRRVRAQMQQQQRQAAQRTTR